MIARIITWNNGELALLVARPNWESNVTVTLDLPTDVSREMITLKESRRNFAQSARYTLEWTTYLSNAADAQELRVFLQRVRSEQVAAPVWPDQCELATNIIAGQTHIQLVDVPVRFGAAWIIANADFSLFEIVAASSLNGNTLNLAVGAHRNWTADGTVMLYPLLFGRLADRPKPESLTDESCEVALKVKESSSFSLRLSVLSGTIRIVGANLPAFATTTLFDVVPNFSKPLDWTELPDVLYETVGFLRNDQQRDYSHRNARGLELEFYQAQRSDITQLERIWRAQRGTTLPLMIPTWRGDMRMRADTPVPAHPTWINIEDSEFCDASREAQPGDQFVALIGSTNTIDPRQLSQTSGVSGSMRLVSTTNMSTHIAATTILSQLILARFHDLQLQWTYTTPYLATTRVKFVELPAEYASAPSPLPEPAYLFIFVENGVRTDRFTSYENAITITGGTYAGTYTPAPFSFDALKTGLKLDQEKLDFKSFKFTGNPLNKLWPFALDGTLTLEVVEVNATNPQSSTAISRFYGDVWSVDSDYKATAIAFGNFFERKFPRFLLQTSDNYTQFSPPTHLAASAFVIAGTLSVTNSQIITITSAAAHAKATDYFSGGWIEIGSGVNYEQRGILHSEPASGSQVTLHIDRPVIKNVVGGAQGPSSPGPQPPAPKPPDSVGVNLYPGYDGSIDQCDSKFNNRINFGGHPYTPDINPAVKAMDPVAVQGGKK